MNLTIDENADARKSYIVSLIDVRSLKLPFFYFGDILPLYIQVGDGEGGLSSFNGRADVILVAGIGDPATRSVYGQTDLTWNGQSYYGELDLNTQALSDAISSEEKISSFFEVNATFYGGDRHTLLQQDITIRNQLIQ